MARVVKESYLAPTVDPILIKFLSGNLVFKKKAPLVA